MEPDDFFQHAAKAISDLINQRPWSATVEELAQVIEEAWWQLPVMFEEGLGRLLDAAKKRRRRRRGEA